MAYINYHLRLDARPAGHAKTYVSCGKNDIYYEPTWIGQAPKSQEKRFDVVIKALSNIREHYNQTMQVPISVDLIKSVHDMRIIMKTELSTLI